MASHEKGRRNLLNVPVSYNMSIFSEFKHLLGPNFLISHTFYLQENNGVKKHKGSVSRNQHEKMSNSKKSCGF